jgi:hypothetical protein
VEVATGAVALALGAAVLHAVWNLLLAGAEDTDAATAVALALSVVLYAPIALLTWDVDAAAWPYIAGSAAFEIGYVATLAAGLGRGDLSVVYPLARGSAPVLVLAVSAGLLGAATSTWQVAGVGLAAAGVVLVRGLRRPDDPIVVALALACGACIAGYTVVDAHGLDHAAALPYLWASLTLTAVVYLPLVVRMRGTAPLRRAVQGRTVVAAVLFFGAYWNSTTAANSTRPIVVSPVRPRIRPANTGRIQTDWPNVATGTSVWRIFIGA